MPQAVSCVNLVATKLASGNVSLMFMNPVGGVRFLTVLKSADVASLHQVVNAGGQGTSVTYIYPQDTNKADYPRDRYEAI